MTAATSELDILANIDEAIVEARSDFGTPKNWRFSDLGKCLRLQYMKRRGETGAPFTPETLILFRVGDLLEIEALNWLGAKYPVFTRTSAGERITVDVPEFNARGALDALAVVDREFIVVEVKSTRNRALEYSDLPYKNHRLQALGYAYYLGLSRALIVYVGRDGAKKVFWERVTPDVVQEITHSWAELERYWLTEELPPVKPKIRAKKKVKGEWVDFTYEVSGPWGAAGEPKFELDPECGYCSFKAKCWGDQR